MSRDDWNTDDFLEDIERNGEIIEEIFCHLVEEMTTGNESAVCEQDNLSKKF